MLSFQEELILPLVILAVLMVILAWVYRRTNPALARSSKIILVLLRALALILLVVVLIRPLFGLTYTSKMPPEVAVLVDNSASMKLEDAPVSRAKALNSILNSGLWEELEKKGDVRFFKFADTLQKATPDPGQFDLKGKSTSISTALLQLQKQSPDLSAAVIISDGGHNSGPDPGPVAGQLNFPVYALGVGTEEMPPDLAITDLDYPQEVFQGTSAGINLSVAGTGIPSQKLKLVLTESGKVRAEKEILISGKGEKQNIKLEITPETEGVHTYEVSLPRLQGEITYLNNQRKFSWKVQKSRLKVLCLTGNLTWEYHFLKRFLDSQKNLENSYVVYDNQRIVEGKVPQNQADLNRFDLVIWVSPGSRLLAGQESLLEEFVSRQGKSVLFILDNNFFSFVPINSRLKILPFDPAGLTLSYIQSSLVLAEPAEFDPILRLSENPGDNLSLWRDLPPFLGALLPNKVSPAARVLAKCQPEAKSPASPVLLTQEFGKGKVMCTLAFPLWRWDFVLAGLSRTNEVYSKLWSNSIRWLTAQKKEKNFDVTTDQPVYKAGEKINFKATYLDELGEKITGGEVKLRLTNLATPDKVDLVLSPDQEKDYVGSLNFLPPGDYRLEGAYSSEGTTLAQVKHEFMVEEYSLEDQALTMNRQVLTQIAEVSGGKFYTIKDYQNLASDLVLRPRVVDKEKNWELWNQPGFLVFAILLLSMEWFLRKRRQLP